MDDIVHREVYKGHTIKIYPDFDPGSPREWDNLGTIAHWHRHYKLGEVEITDMTEWLLQLIDEAGGDRYALEDCGAKDDALWTLVHNQYVVLPVALLDHSGLRMWIGSGPSPFDPGGWDSGQVGWIYCSREKAKKEFSRKRWSLALQKKVKDILTAEINTFDQLLSGDVYGFVIEDENENHIDSCWGFYGFDYCLEEAKKTLAVILKHLGKSHGGS